MIKKKNLDPELVNYVDNLGMGMEARGALGATIYYVDGNAGKDSWDGLSVDYPFQTIAKACSVSHSNMARRKRWARRNTIYVFGDACDEDLTALAQKTDIVFLGQCDGFGVGGRIKGNHVISGSTWYGGCRLFNGQFLDNDSSGTTWTIPTLQSGISFVNCDFLAYSSTVVGLLVTASAYFRVKGCRFLGSWNAGFSTAAIDIGAGIGHGTMIEDCIIANTHATGVDIRVNISRAGSDSFIKGNYCTATAITLDDNSDTFYVMNNYIVSKTAATAGYAEIIDINAALASGNNLTTTNVNGPWPILDTTT